MALFQPFIPKLLGIAARRQVSDKFVWNKFAQPSAGLWLEPRMDLIIPMSIDKLCDWGEQT